MRFVLVCFFIVMIAGCALSPPPPHDTLVLKSVSFDDLPGWSYDMPASALEAFRHSCMSLLAKPDNQSLGLAGPVSAWRPLCADAQIVMAGNEAARAFFQQSFRPYAVRGRDGYDGLFTGYYVPELRGALHQGGLYQTPLYARPDDLITVDLGVFNADLKGQHIVGKVTDHRLVPYDDRQSIATGSLTHRAQVLAWIDDPIGAFFLEVQGSGRVRLQDGTVLTVGYDGANGRAYRAIGRVMADRGDIPRPVTMSSIRAWLEAHPDKAQEALDINPSYVFFRRLPGEDVVGAEGVTLTPERSLAVDPSFIPMGVPLWVDTTDGHGAPLQHLMIAQDTGGAIKGPIRGDVFWGAGPDAAAQAGAMQSRGRYYLLLPKTVQLYDD